MSCSPFDLKDYFFGELPAADRSATESHLAACSSCREEMARLGETRALLMSIPDEEPPRRIAFVSDKVFEPRWYQRLWASGPQLGFASAAVLAVAIMVHGVLLRPVATADVARGPVPAVSVSTQSAAQGALTPADVDRLVQAKLAEREAEHTQRILQVIDAKTRQLDYKRRNELILLGEYMERNQLSSQQLRKSVVYGE